MEDMPKNVTNTWRNWCSYADYLFHPKNSKNIEGIDAYQNLKFTVTIFTVTDDYICIKANVESFWKHVHSLIMI
jgi:predicted alpha/beta hydrolase